MKPYGLTEYPKVGEVWEYAAGRFASCYACPFNGLVEGEKLFETYWGTYCEKCWNVMQKQKGAIPTGDLLVTSKAKYIKKEAPVSRKAKTTKAGA